MGVDVEHVVEGGCWEDVSVVEGVCVSTPSDISPSRELLKTTLCTSL